MYSTLSLVAILVRSNASPLSISKGEIFLVACELDFCGAIPSSPLEHLSQLDDDRVDCVAR